MDYETFLIADFKSGLTTDHAPWLLPQDAFQEITNAYINDGVIYKRKGMEFFAKMVHYETDFTKITVTNPGIFTVVDASGLVEGQHVQISFATGGLFPTLNGLELIIINLVGNSFNLTTLDGTLIDTSTFGGYAGGGVLCIFPGLPIMGIKQFVTTSDETDTLFWDTRRMGIYNAITNAIDPIDMADIFTGDNSNFVSVGFYGKNPDVVVPICYFCNFCGKPASAINAIRSYVIGAGLTNTVIFRPQTSNVGVGNFVEATQFIHNLEGRLILLNTVETINGGANTQFPQRIRWSRWHKPDDALANWDETTPGSGGYLDIDTADVIIGSKALGNRIVIFMSNSTWRVDPTSNPAQPVKFTKLNSFRSSDCPYATIDYDKFVISIGQRGIFACDAVEVKRVDDSIQEYIVENFNLTRIEQAYSERNYVDQRSWTLFPSTTYPTVLGDEQTTSDCALIRNEEEGSFSTFTLRIADDLGVLQNFSCLGFGNASKDYTFADFNGLTLPDYAWENFGDEDFLSYFLQDKAELFLGGDQIGRIFILEKGTNDNGADISMSLTSAGWNPYKDKGTQAQLGFLDLYVDSDFKAKITLRFYKDDMINPYKTISTYLLPKIGFLSDIQNALNTNPCIVESWDHGIATGEVVYIYCMEGMGELLGGPYTVTNIDQGSFSLDGVDATAFSAYVSGGKVTENPYVATRCWKRVPAGGIGYTHYVTMDSAGQNETVNIHAFRAGFRQTGTKTTQ